MRPFNVTARSPGAVPTASLPMVNRFPSLKDVGSIHEPADQTDMVNP